MEQQPANNHINITFGDLIKKCLSRWKFIAMSVIVFTALGVLWAKISTPRSEVIANVLITSEDGMGAAGSMALEIASNFSMGDMFGSNRTVDDELAVMRSHSVYRQTVKDMKLNEIYTVKENFLKKIQYYTNPPVSLSYPAELADTLSIPIRFKLHVDAQGKVDVTTYFNRHKYSKVEGLTFPAVLTNPYGSFTLDRSADFRQGETLDETIILLSYDGAADAYSQILEAFIPNKKADMISISLLSTDPRYACKIVNNFIENYNTMGIEEKRERDNLTSKFVAQRLASLSDELADAESDIEKFKREQNLVDVETQAGLMLENANTQNNQLLEAETEYEILGMIRNFIADPANRYSLLPPLLSDDGSLAVLQNYNDLILKRLSMEGSARNDNAQLRLITEQIDAMRDNVIQSLDKKYEHMGVRVAEFRRQVNKTNAFIDQIPAKERQYVNMKRQQIVKEQLYLYLLRQQEEVAISIANARPRGLVIDAAYISTFPVGLTPIMKIILLFLLGWIFPVLYIYIAEKFRKHITSRDDVDAVTTLPVLGEVSATGNDNCPVVREGDSTVTGALFRIARANLVTLLGDNLKVTTVTSPADNDGKTFVALNIASALALTGKRTVIIDTELNGSGLSAVAGLAGGKGLADYLSGNIDDINSIIRRNALTGTALDVITAGQHSVNASDLLAGDRFKNLIASLRENYDYIILDADTLEGNATIRSVNRVTDATVIVFRAGKTLYSEIHRVNEIAGALNHPAVIVNDVQAKKHR